MNKLEIANTPKEKAKNIEVGDLVAFLDLEGDVASVYVICFDKEEQWYYVQNLNGTKTKIRGYYTIDALFEKRKNYRIIKAEKVKLMFDFKDGFTYGE